MVIRWVLSWTPIAASVDADTRSTGKILNSSTGVYALAGTRTRTPGRYHRTDPNSGRLTSQRLRNTGEFIHASVRTRIELGGPGIEDRGEYDPRALRSWELFMDRDGPVWEHYGDESDQRPDKILYEDDLGDTERMLLKRDPELYDYVLKGGAVPRWARD